MKQTFFIQESKEKFPTKGVHLYIEDDYRNACESLSISFHFPNGQSNGQKNTKDKLNFTMK